MRKNLLVLVIALSALASGALADEVVFRNGDRLTGKIETYDGKSLIVTTPAVGPVAVALAEVRTFSTEAAIEAHLTDGTVLNAPAAAGEAGQILLAGRAVAFGDLAKINPPPAVWTGSLNAAGAMTRGNSWTETASLGAELSYRAEKSRIGLAAGYVYGRQRDPDTGERQTSADAGFVDGKFDYFFAPRFFGYAGLRADHDQIADLEYRVAPGVGAGFQVFDGPALSLAAEGGFAYLFEKYDGDGEETDHAAARIAYHLAVPFGDRIALGHNVEYLPSLEESGDYNLNADAGVKMSLTKAMFGELKAEWRVDSTPAPDADDTDSRILLGIGWKF